MNPKTSRARRRPVFGKPSYTFALSRALVADPRFAGLNATAQAVAQFCVTQHGDGAGRFWPKTETIADALGCNKRTVSRALADLTDAEILTCERYLRPDGRYGSNTYQLGAAIRARADTIVASWKPAASAQEATDLSSGQEATDLSAGTGDDSGVSSERGFERESLTASTLDLRVGNTCTCGSEEWIPVGRAAAGNFLCDACYAKRAA